MKIFLALLLGINLMATPTLTKKRTFTQNDGSTFSGRLQGDAFLHWIEAEDGSILLYNKKTATFEYAEIKNGNLVSTHQAYRPSLLRKTFNKEALKTLWQQKHPKRTH